jgi:hypothetical protein
VQQLWLVDGHVFEERTDCRQPRIPASGSVAARRLDVCQERADKLRVDVRQLKRGRFPTQAAGGKLQ